MAGDRGGWAGDVTPAAGRLSPTGQKHPDCLVTLERAAGICPISELSLIWADVSSVKSSGEKEGRVGGVRSWRKGAPPTELIQWPSLRHDGAGRR